MPAQAVLLTSAKIALHGNRGSFSNNLSFETISAFDFKIIT